MSNFRPINRDTGFLLPPSVDEWLPPRHLARFVVEGVEGLDLSQMVKRYRGSGSASCHPAMLLALLIYGYATQVFSSRAIERATYDSVAFRYLAGNEHPDHDTPATFRKRFLAQIEALFVEVLKLARTLGMLKLEPARCGWDQDPRQREPPQRALLRPREEAREAAQAGGATAAEARRAGGCRRYPRWHVDPRGA